MTSLYSLGDVRRAYRWLGHGTGVTEVSVLHPLYRRGDRDWNRSQGAWPVTRYIRSEPELLGLVRGYAGERMVCYGINPRPMVLTCEDGRVRSAREADVAVSQNLLIDIDLEGVVTPSRLDSLRRFLRLADEYFKGLGVHRPFRASTGRGSHLLFAYPPIPVGVVPDVRLRLRSFKEGFVAAVGRELSVLEARVDATQDLRRMTRVYGTSKPGVGVIIRQRLRNQVQQYLPRTRIRYVNGKNHLTSAFHTLKEAGILQQHLIRYHPLLAESVEVFVSVRMDREDLTALLNGLRPVLHAVETYPTSEGYWCRLLGPHKVLDAIINLPENIRERLSGLHFHTKRHPAPIVRFQYETLFDRQFRLGVIATVTLWPLR